MNSKKIGYLAGVFDFCHEGHISIITRALKLCDKLIVAVVSDSFALKYKKQRIEYNEDERVAMIESLDLVDDVVIVDNNDHKSFFDEYNVTHLFHGTDWEKESYIDFMGREDIENRNIKVSMLSHTKGISSTLLRNLQIESKTINQTQEK
ncbi:MAG: hypothetical protein CMB62_02610 [Euryarchaeota archaeon]|mgnify:FL=1|nr:hypothetical protein [Euryarchaeota archaeon]|tara:strand:+ start:2326 stop:2775 length:450 start_codon:yes stop_codon:yes gene_type:complete